MANLNENLDEFGLPLSEGARLPPLDHNQCPLCKKLGSVQGDRQEYHETYHLLPHFKGLYPEAILDYVKREVNQC